MKDKLAGQHPPKEADKVYAYARTHADRVVANEVISALTIGGVELYVRRRIEDAYVAGWYGRERLSQ